MAVMRPVFDALAALPPWDAASYFQAIVERGVALAMGSSVQLCVGDPMRVGLIMEQASIGNVVVSTLPGSNGTTGLLLDTSRPGVTLLFRDSGPLCQQAWWGWSSGNATITVYEISLYRWPQLRPPTKAVKHVKRARSTHGQRDGS